MQFLSPTALPFLSTSLPQELSQHPSSLVILGRGLGNRRMVIELLRTLSGSPTSIATSKLILVLNASKDADWIIDTCSEFTVPPIKIEKETVSRRKDTYEKGGVFIPTARTLVMDLLSGSIPPGLIYALLILDADKVDDTSNEMFCVHLVKANSPSCYIQAFSHRPERFTSLSKLNNMVRTLRVSHVSLWPRNREEIQRDLNTLSKTNKCIELIQPLSPLMIKIQDCLIELVEYCVEELRTCPNVDISGLTAEHNLFRAFDVQLRAQLAPKWNMISFKAKFLMRDLNVLRKLLWSLLTMDSVTFFSRLLEVKEENETRDHLEGRATWLLTDAADRLFQAARARLWTTITSSGSSSTTNTKQEKLRISLEPDCKIQALKQLLDKITIEQSNLRTSMGISLELLGGVDVVVVVPDDDTRYQVQAELCDLTRLVQISTTTTSASSGVNDDLKPWMSRLEHKFWRFLEKHFYKRDKPSFRVSPIERDALKRECENLSIRRDGKNVPPGSTIMGFDHHTTTQSSTNMTTTDNNDTSMNASSTITRSVSHSSLDFLQVRCLTREEQISICTWKDVSQGYLDRVLPRFVISYCADHAMVREMEMFQSTHPKFPLYFYMLYYKNSVEEQRFLASIKRERDAFMSLIRDKINLSIIDTAPGEQQQQQQQRSVHTSSSSSSSLNSNSNNSSSATQIRMVSKHDVVSGKTIQVPELAYLPSHSSKKIIIDTRELPSALPFWLHQKGFTIDLRTLQVGDYVLSPKICIERKSPFDLYGSLKGESRLLAQIPSMLRHYERVMLLIEYPDNSPFSSLENYMDEKKTIDFDGLMSKLTMLSLEYSDMRIIWSMKPSATVSLFEELQKNQDPPDGDRAEEKEKDKASIGFSEYDKVNLTAINILKRLPGVTDENVFKLARGAKSLSGLCQFNVEQLTQLMDSSHAANKLYEFLNRQVVMVEPHLVGGNNNNHNVNNNNNGM
jgi:DNA excision repair protein ERCC-4